MLKQGLKMRFDNFRKILFLAVLCQSGFAFSGAVDIFNTCNDPIIKSINRSSVPDDSTAAALYDNCLAARKIICLDNFKMMNELYEETMNYWTNKSNKNQPLLYLNSSSEGTFNSNIHDNFNDIVLKHRDSFRVLKSDISAAILKIRNSTNTSQVRPYMSTQETLIKNSIAKFKEVEIYDEKFLRMLSFELGTLEAVVPLYKTLEKSDTCIKTFNIELLMLKNHFTSWKKELDNLRGYVTGARVKRNMIVDAVDDVLRGVAFDRYFSLVGDSSREAIDKMAKALFVINLSVEIDRWWLPTSANGLAGRLHTVYYQYTMPMRILKANLHDLEKFEGRLSALTDDYGRSAIELVRKSIHDKRRLINDNLSYVENIGWMGMNNKQKKSIDRSSSTINAKSEFCRSTLDSYYKSYNAINDYASYKETESFYYTLATSCIR